MKVMYLSPDTKQPHMASEASHTWPLLFGIIYQMGFVYHTKVFIAKLHAYELTMFVYK